MARKSGHISILQVDDRLISLLRVRRSSRGVDVIAMEQEAGEWSEQDGSLAEALKTFVKQKRVYEDSVYTVLPRHEMTSRILVLPSQDPDEIAGMIRLGAEEYMPYSAEELVIDECILQKLPDGLSRVLAVFAHRDVVDAHVKMLQDAGVDPVKIFVSTACLASAAIAAGGETDERYALVNLSPGGLDVLILNGHRLEFARGVATNHDWSLLGRGDHVEADEELNVEVRASLSAARRENEEGLGAERIYLCSEWADVEPAAEILYHETGYESKPATFVHQLLHKSAERVTALPLVAIGAALAAQDRAPIAMNLVPESLLAAREQASLRTKIFMGAGVAAGLLISVLAYYGLSVYQRQAYIDELQQQVEAVRPIAESVISKQRSLQLLQRRVDRSGTALEMLGQAIALAPESGLNLTKFTYSRNREVVIEGRVTDRTNSSRYSEELRQAAQEEFPLFSRARLGTEREVIERNRRVFQYEIVIPIDDPDAEGDYID